MPDNGTILVERPTDGVAVITLNRPDRRNALDVATTCSLDATLLEVSSDPDVRAIVLRAAGGDFCSGHDLADAWRPGTDQARASGYAPMAAGGVDGFSAFERELFFELPERWRNLPTPTVAAVQGRCIAGGLALALACDLVVAADDTLFVDPTVALGACGPEHFSYPFDLGARTAKYLLLTGDVLDAATAHRLGLVCEVHARDRLDEAALALAGRIAAKPAFAARMTKEAINLAEDIGGRRAAMQAMFPIHQLCHAENLLRHGLPINPASLPPAAVAGVRRFVTETATWPLSSTETDA